MRIIFSYLFCLFAFVACVPVAKYNMVQNELRNSLNANILSQSSNKSLQLILDSTRNSILDFKSDYNSLSFELEDIQRSSIFSDRDLLKQLNLVRAEHKTLLNSINQAQARSEYAVWLSNERANSFSKDAKCELEIYSKNNFLLVNKNIVLLDLEGLLGTSTEHQAEFKKALVELIKPLQNRNDWNMRVCLYQGGLQPEWTKMTLQNEAMGFFVMEAKLPTTKVQSVTRIISNEGNVEFGFADKSRLFVEFEFNG